MKNILSIGKDSKTVKGQKYGYLTGILYLAPYDISGYNVCPMAKKANCFEACLYTAGHGAYSNVKNARIAKTKMFHENRQQFIDNLKYSIDFLVRKSKKLNLIPLVRLNGTSDIIWENIPFNEYKNVFDAYPNVQFYDYTKIPTRKNIPSNYDLTFSYSGAASFFDANKKALLNDKLSHIAVVFDKKENIPNMFMDKIVIDGDNSDIRHIDAKNVIIGLYAKGKAKKDNSGFVVKKD